MNERTIKMMPKCNRCGYEFNPAKPEKPVLEMILTDGRKATACYGCMVELGMAKTDKEKDEIIKQFTGGNEQ